MFEGLSYCLRSFKVYVERVEAYSKKVVCRWLIAGEIMYQTHHKFSFESMVP